MNEVPDLLVQLFQTLFNAGNPAAFFPLRCTKEEVGQVDCLESFQGEKGKHMVLTCPTVVLENFTDHKDKIISIFRESNTFQNLCEDYLKCYVALGYWNQSSLEEAPLRREEYTKLLEDLSEEIRLALDEG
jgi:hypothetical protein